MGFIVYGIGRFSGKVTVNGLYYVYDTKDLSIEVSYGSQIKDCARLYREDFDNVGFQFKLSEPEVVLTKGVYEATQNLIVVVNEDMSYNVWYCGYMVDRLFYTAEDGSLKVYMPERLPIGVLDGNLVTIYNDYATSLIPGKYRRPEPISKEDFLRLYTS